MAANSNGETRLIWQGENMNNLWNVLLLSAVLAGLPGCSSFGSRDRDDSSSIKPSKTATETAINTVAEMSRLYHGSSEERK